MRRLVVTGASGLLGANLVLEVGGLHETIAFSGRHRLRGLRSRAVDLTNPSATVAALRNARPDVIIHCAAATNVDECERAPDLAWRVNVGATTTVATAARDLGARLVHISTDAVFDGERGHYREDDPTGPVNVYARSKLAAELATLSILPSALIVRTSIYGWNARPKSSLAEWILGRLAGTATVPGFVDVHFTPVLANDLARALLALLDKDAEGILHVSGVERVSKYDFARAVARVFGHDEDRIVPTSVVEAGLAAPRPRDTSLDTGRAASMGIVLPDVASGLDRFARLADSGYPQRLRSLVSATA